MMRLLLFIAFLSVSSSEVIPLRSSFRQSYVCPPKFVRQGHRCYFFSKQAMTWSDALFECREKHSNLAIVQNKNQDKLIRSFLSKKTLDPLERWLGGVYDWGNMAWKWAASGKALSYNGFPKEAAQQNKETLQWHCIIMDPAKQYLWSSRTCTEKKHFICQTRLKMVDNKDKKKLYRQYNASKDNKLNEIPVPLLLDDSNNSTFLKQSAMPITYRFEINEKLANQSMYAYKSPEMIVKVKSKNAKRKRKTQRNKRVRLSNGRTIQKERRRGNHKRRLSRKPEDLGEPTLIKNIRWRTYHKEEKLPNPLYPQPIIEEYNYVQDRF